MTKTCIQCGKEFELSESEISFFEGKGLELPKRCASCRKQNKRSRSRRYHYKKDGGRSFEEKRSRQEIKTEEIKEKTDTGYTAAPAFAPEEKEKKGFFAALIDKIKGKF